MTPTPELLLRLDRPRPRYTRARGVASLMCNFEVIEDAVEARHGVDFDEHFASALAALTPLEDDGLVARRADRVEVTDLGRFLVRNVAMAFDPRLADGRFSQTV